MNPTVLPKGKARLLGVDARRPLPRIWLSLLALVIALAIGFALPGAAHADTPVGGTINTPVHWTIAGSPYVANDIYIVAGGALTIDPGVVVKVNDNMWIRVQGGTLNAGGVGSPVTFTATANRWRYLSVESGSAQLTNCIIEKAGYVASEAGLRIYASAVRVQDTTVRNNAGPGIEISGDGITPSLQNVTVTGNGDRAIFQNTINMAPVYSNVTLNGNGKDAVWLPGTNLNRDVTLDSTGLNGAPLFLDYDLYVTLGTTLTVAPGTTLTVDSDNVWIKVQSGGTLLAQGSAAAPITITTFDGAARWRYLMFENNSHGRLDHVTIERTGYQDNEGGLRILAGDVQVRSSSVLNGGGHGITLEAAGITPTLENVTVAGNAGWGLTQSTANMNPVYSNVTLTDNGKDAVYLPSTNLDRDVTLNGPGVNGSPFVLDYDLYVTPGTSLTLLPGTTLAIDTDNVWIKVQSGGSLLAEGTADQPVVFTANAAAPAPGLYRTIAIEGGSARLSHCVINSAGMYGDPALWIQAGVNVEVHDCRIHGNAGDGIRVDGNAVPNLTHNLIYANGFGVRNTSGTVSVDARATYWGSATGPQHPTLNPGGAGNAVSDRVLFIPYAEDESGAIASRLWLQVAGPLRASPGETADFAAAYYNWTGKTVEDTVLVVNLPTDGEYVDSTGGGIYWPEKHQVFWKLGALPDGTEGAVSVRIRFAWGLPLGWPQRTLAQMAGSNEGADTFDLPAYLAYTPVALPVRVALTEAQALAQIAASADMTALYNLALTGGYRFGQGETVALAGGGSVVQVGLLKPERGAAALLRRDGAWVTLATYTPDQYALRETTGGMTMSLQMPTTEYWGSWAAAQAAAASPEATITKEQCVRNCRLTKLALIVPSLVSKKIAWALAIPDCYACGKGSAEGCGKCMWAILEQLGKNIPGVAELYDLHKCDSECRDPAERSKYVCSSSLTLCAGTSVSWMGRTRPVWISWPCNTSEGMWGGLPQVHYCEQYETCVPGYQSDADSPCKYCEDAFLNRQGAVAAEQDACTAINAAGGSCTTFPGPEIRPAKDPNAKFGPAGDVLPGQPMAYTITYENEGAGTAYGVFIVDDLDPALDPTTLVLQGPGQYYTSTRTIIWSVGDLAPKGEVGAKGSVGFTAKLKAGLADGTVVVNKATVFFPSVPEETPTNPVVNVVMSTVAHPQSLETPYGQPLPIVLRGQHMDGAAITYALDELPLFGTLAGTPPNVTYTPAAGFTGVDRFSFTVSAGAGHSRPAEVQIKVVPSAQYDKTQPEVLWNDPAAGASAVTFSTQPIFTDNGGAAYGPFPTLGMSEALDPATVTAANVSLQTAAGAPVAYSVAYDATLNRITVVPRQALEAGTEYRVTAGLGLRDLSSNAMRSAHSWTFTTQGQNGRRYLYLPLVLRNQ